MCLSKRFSDKANEDLRFVVVSSSRMGRFLQDSCDPWRPTLIFRIGREIGRRGEAEGPLILDSRCRQTETPLTGEPRSHRALIPHANFRKSAIPHITPPPTHPLETVAAYIASRTNRYIRFIFCLFLSRFRILLPKSGNIAESLKSLLWNFFFTSHLVARRKIVRET